MYWVPSHSTYRILQRYWRQRMWRNNTEALASGTRVVACPEPHPSFKLSPTSFEESSVRLLSSRRTPLGTFIEVTHFLIDISRAPTYPYEDIDGNVVYSVTRLYVTCLNYSTCHQFPRGYLVLLNVFQGAVVYKTIWNIVASQNMNATVLRVHVGTLEGYCLYMLFC